MPSWLSLKTVLRCRDFSASRRFYAEILGLPVVEEWGEEQGRGCVFAFGPEGRGGFLEIHQMTDRDPRHRPEFRQPVTSDKIDIQLGTDALDTWVATLAEGWAFVGPETLPWGQRWIRLRDPDGLLVALYEGLDPARLDRGTTEKTTR